MGEGRYKATNRRGGVLPIGSGDDPDFTPVELLLAALAGLRRDRRRPDHRQAGRGDVVRGARAEGDKIRDEQGNRLVDLKLTFEVRFPEGEAGDQAREVLPRALAQTRDRLCTVGPDRRGRRPDRVRRGLGGAALGRRTRARTAAASSSPAPAAGSGLETARALAAQGAEVVLAVRNPAKGEDAARSMTGKVEVRRLDVADLSSVREFAADIGPIDVLINNAGVMAVPYARTVDGFETQLGTNHLGHFALTNLLLPSIADRVVVISSDAHARGEVDLDDLSWERRTYKPFARVRRLEAREPAVPARAGPPAARGRLGGPGGRRAPGLDGDRDHRQHRQPVQDLGRVVGPQARRDAARARAR